MYSLDQERQTAELQSVKPSFQNISETYEPNYMHWSRFRCLPSLLAFLAVLVPQAHQVAPKKEDIEQKYRDIIPYVIYLSYYFHLQ